MSGRHANNAMIGRLFYRALTDSAGYPNGMAHWEEMSPAEKYHHAATGVLFARMLVDGGYVSEKAEFGLEGIFGEGDCADLMRHIEATAAAEREAFGRKVEAALLRGGPGPADGVPEG